MAWRGRAGGRIRDTRSGSTAAARELRRNMTGAERVLWQAIRERQLGGLRFRRQHAVGPYILDFYCPSCKLVIEVDGEVHDEQAEYDADRTQYLHARGYQVIRFRNAEIRHDLTSVLQRILRAAATGDPKAPPDE